MIGAAYRWFERPIRWGIVGGVWAWESSRGSSLGLGVLLWELGRGGSGSEAGLWGLGGGYDAQSRPPAVPTPRRNSLLSGQYCGQRHYSESPEILILADGGGSNSYRSRNWKRQLQVALADAYGLSVTVCHYPRGASKWNPIEHRLFSEITKTWAGVPLDSFEVLLAGIKETTTETGLSVEAHLVERVYATGIRVSDEEMALLAVESHATCPQWNYTIRPRQIGK